MSLEFFVDHDRDFVAVQTLDLFTDADVAVFDFKAVFTQCQSDFMLRDTTKKQALFVGSTLHGDFVAFELFDDCSLLGEDFFHFSFHTGTLFGQAVDGALGGGGGHAVGQQVVAGITGFDFHDIADDAEVIDVLS